MKIVLIVLAVGFIAVLVLGYLFVQWANKPENVAAMQQQQKDEAAKKIEDEKRKIEIIKEAEAKRANLKLVIDENFADKRFNYLDYKYNRSFFKFEENQFTYEVTIYKGQSPANEFIYSKEDYGDFAAEMNFDIWGRATEAGIFWDAQPNGEQPPKKYQAAYATSSGLDVRADDDTDSYGLGTFFESLTTQKIRVERFGKSLKVIINDKVYFDKIVESSDQGKIGIYLGHQGGIKDSTQGLTVNIKSFKVWK